MSLRILRQNDAPVPANAARGVVCQAARGCSGCLVRHLAVCAALPVSKAQAMEALAEAAGTPLPTLTLEQQEAFWDGAKRLERGQSG